MKPLSLASALHCAFFDAETRAFPSCDGKRLEQPEIADSIRAVLDTIPEVAAKTTGFSVLLEKAKESLKEAKGQTEYQDQKIARLLTIIAFVTAAAGAIFSKVVDSYPIDHAAQWAVSDILVYGAYLLFFIFVLLVAAGAMISFHATRTRFIWNATRPNVVERDKLPTSHLFFQESIRTSPENWARSFSADVNAQTLEAYKGYVIESYLVNAKIADKLRLLEPAQAILSHAIRFLFAWLFLVVFLFIFVERPKTNDQVVPAAVTVHGEARAASESPRPSVSNDKHADVHGQNIVVNCAPAPRTTPPGPPSIKHSTAHACAGPVAGQSETASVVERQ